MTLLELTVVILVMLALVSVMFIGALAWRRGSDRALCIVQIQNVQKGIRCYANLYGYNQGETVLDLQSKVVGVSGFVESVPRCPANGTYNFGGDTIPLSGTLYMECDLATLQQHEPSTHSEW